MRRVQVLGAAVLLAVSTYVWAEGPYPQTATDADVPAKTRAQVVAELHEATRQGMVSYGEGDTAVRAPIQTQSIAESFRRFVELASGGTQDTGQPAIAQAEDTVVVWGERSVPRVQVRAETLEAARLGLLENREDGNFPTTAQLEMIAAAGVRALSGDWIVGSR